MLTQAITIKYITKIMGITQTNRIMKTNKYKCVHCKKVVERDSSKQWIKSYCVETGKTVRLQKQTETQT
jgi:hypothetical protein